MQKLIMKNSDVVENLRYIAEKTEILREATTRLLSDVEEAKDEGMELEKCLAIVQIEETYKSLMLIQMAFEPLIKELDAAVTEAELISKGFRNSIK